MRSLRKTLVAALVVAMVVGLAGSAAAQVTIAGKPFTDAVGHAYEKELTMMRALGIMLGDTGTTLVRPDAPITRAEMAIVIVRMLGRDALANALASYQPTFTDAVPTWAWGHVNVAVNMGIIKGYGDGTFGANNNVTHAESLAMLIRATGHEPGVVGVWPINYMMTGYELGIIGKVEAFANLPATRGEIAHFVHNTLFIKQGKVQSGIYNPEAEESILKKAGRLWTGKVAAYDLTAKSITIGTEAAGLADSVYLWTYTAFPQLLNAQVRAVANTAKKVVFIEPFVTANIVTGLFSKIEGGKIFLKGVTDGYTLDSGVAYKLNSDDASGVDLAVDDSVSLTIQGGKVVLVDAFRVDVTNAIVTAVKTTAPMTITAGGATYNVAANTIITLNGATAALGDLKANDVVYIATKKALGADAINIEAVRQTVSGTVVQLRTIYTGPTTSYKMVDLKLADGTTKGYRLDGPADPAVGSTVTYGLNKAGHARVAIAATFATSYVKLTGWEAGITPARATFDVAGTSVTHPVASGANFTHSDIGKVGKLVLNPATGQAEWLVMFPAIGSLSKGRIFSIDTANNIVTIEVYSGGWTSTFVVSTKYVTAYVATSGDAGIGAFTPLANLQVGDRVYYLVADAWNTDPKLTYCMESGDTGKVIFVLRRFTRTQEW